MNTPNKENYEVKNHSCPLKLLNSGTLKACNKTLCSLPTTGFFFLSVSNQNSIFLGLCPLAKPLLLLFNARKRRN